MMKSLFLVLILACSVAFADDCEVTENGYCISNDQIQTYEGMPEPSVSLANQGKLYYDQTAQELYISKDTGAWSVIGSGGSDLTVKDVNGDVIVTEVETIEFLNSSGFEVTDEGSNTARIAMNSSWNPISVSGQSDLDASGEEELEIIAGTGIILTTDTGATPQSLTIATSTTSPLTTKGDIYTYGTSEARLPAGTNTYLLSANSSETTGLEWIDPSTVGTTTYLGLTDVPGTFTAGSIPYTNSGADALLHDANFNYDGTHFITGAPVITQTTFEIGHTGQAIVGDVTKEVTDNGSGTLWTVEGIQTAHFKMNDYASSTVIVDDVAAANGALAGGDNTEDLSATGKINEAMNLDGSADYIDSNINLSLGTDQSWSMWIYHDNLNSSDGFMGVHYPTDNDRWYARSLVTSGYSNIGLGITSNSSSNSVTAGAWHWIYLKWTDSSNTMSLYCDTVLIHSWSADPQNATGDIFIGAVNYHAFASGFFDGKIDDFRAFNAHLSAEQISGLYNSGDGTEADSESVGFTELTTTSVYTLGDYRSLFITETPTFNTKQNLGVEGVIEGRSGLYSGNTIESLGDLIVNTDVLVANAISKKVGINKANPSVELDVAGEVVITGDVTVDTDLFVIDSAADTVTLTDGELIVAGTGDSNFGDVLYVAVTDEKVGINTTTPVTALDVDGASRFNKTRIDSTDSPYAVTGNDHKIFADTDGGDIEIDLLAGANAPDLRFENCGSSGNILTVDPNGTEQIFALGAGVAATFADEEWGDIEYETTEGWR